MSVRTKPDAMEPIMITCTCYMDPDLDGFSSAIAYAEFLRASGQEAVARIFGEPQPEVSYVMRRFGFPYPEARPASCERVILVDASELRDLDKSIVPANVIEVIDHRAFNDVHLFTNAKIQLELVGAAATLVAERYMQRSLAISVMSATLLEAAIVSNTLDFKARVTTKRDRHAAEWLHAVSNLPPSFAEELFAAKSDFSGAKLQKAIEGDFAWFDLGAARVGIAQLEMVGAWELANSRSGEIVSELSRLRRELRLGAAFATLADAKACRNVFLAEDKKAEALLQRALGISFENGIAFRDGILMRKELVPLLKDVIKKLG